MKKTDFIHCTVICSLLIAGLLAASCSDDDKGTDPVTPTPLAGTWATLGTGVGLDVDGGASAFTLYDDKLILGGGFFSVDGVNASNIAAWNGSSWAPLGSGTSFGAVRALATWGDLLIIGGGFSSAGGVNANNVAAWDGSSWSALGAGRGKAVFALSEYLTALVVGGDNGTGGGLAVFDGLQWTNLTQYMYIVDFTIYDGDLIIGGMFSDIGTESGDNVVAFDGATFTSLGSGTNGNVYSLTTYDGKLIAAGDFTSASGINVGHIAAWDGSTWAPLGEGIDGTVSALAVFDGKLFAAGSFTSAGGVSADNIAAWDGSSWKALESGTDNYIQCLIVYDNMLIIGGNFDTAGGVSVRGIATWTPE